MNYGYGETAQTDTTSETNVSETNTAAETNIYASFTDELWSNPPADVNSEEYRIWYERYCNYFYPSQTAAETTAASLFVDTDNTDALPGSNNTASEVSSTTVTTTVAANIERPSDPAVDSTADNTTGKKRKKGKKNDPANPKPTEPPGELQLYNY